MSRIGRKEITLPEQVNVATAQREVTVKGPLGTLSLSLPAGIEIALADRQLRVTRQETDGSRIAATHGLVRSLLANMVQGVAAGFQKQLEIQGVGFKAQATKQILTLHVGFTHPVELAIPAGITIETPKPTHVIVKGIDKQVVGQMAADIRAVFPPEPYKGKGIRYAGELVRRKAGKSAAGKGAGGKGAAK